MGIHRLRCVWLRSHLTRRLFSCLYHKQGPSSQEALSPPSASFCHLVVDESRLLYFYYSCFLSDSQSDNWAAHLPAPRVSLQSILCSLTSDSAKTEVPASSLQPSPQHGDGGGDRGSDAHAGPQPCLCADSPTRFPELPYPSEALSFFMKLV